jgi:hypothetical protein
MVWIPAILLAIAGPCAAATWVVDQGGGGDFTTIMAGVNAASYGDTVLVRPGYYAERVDMKNGIHLKGSGAAVTIIDNSNWIYSAVILNGTYDATTIVERFRITGGVGPGWSAAGVWLGLDCSAIVRYNVITANQQGIMCNCNNGRPTIDHNTIAWNDDCGIQIYTGGVPASGVALITNNIVVQNAHYGIYRGSSSTVPLPPHPDENWNDVWGNTTNYHSITQGSSDISADPLFCGPYTNLYIDAMSPCAGGGENGTYIGAFKVGCGVSSVQSKSWGSIKALYR